MSDSTPRLMLPELAQMQELNAATINEALAQLDAVTDLYLKGQFVNTPPSSPVDGDTYLLGASPTGLWSGRAYKIAYCLDGAWRFFTPFDGLRAVVASSGNFIFYQGGAWKDFAPPPSGAEASVPSAATCDIGSPGSLCVAITGTTTISSFGGAAGALRFVRFAGALVLTHHATSLVLLGGASRAVAAGDSGIYRSDASGNWRELSFTRAVGCPGFIANRGGVDQTGMAAGAASKIAFHNVVRNDGGYYDGASAYRFAPPPGVYDVRLGINANTGTNGETCEACIYRNGVWVLMGPYMNKSAGSNFRSTFSGHVVMNGGDYLEAYAYMPATVTTLLGAADSTYFSAYKVRDL